MHISTLITDIHQTIKQNSNWFTDDLATDLGNEVAKRIKLHYAPRDGKGTLRLSQMGAKCPRALWYSYHHPELAEPLSPSAIIKYSYGHLIEAQTISLCKAAGHEVTGEQDEVVVDGIKGHRDCVIDGCIVDVKSAATPSMEKFRTGSIKDNDLFGYLDQLDGYLVGSASDPLVRCKDRGYILAVDKTLGHMVLYEHRLRAQSIIERIAEYKQIVAMDNPPDCQCGTIAEDNGNIKLDVKASYSPYKFCCFPLLRTFIYAKGVVFFVKVEKVPKNKGVPLAEVDKYGNIR